MGVATLNWNWDLNQFLQYKAKFLDQCLKAIHPKDDELFVIWDSSFPYESISIFDDFEKFRTFHIFPLAVFQTSPHGQAMLDHFKVHDVFKDLVDNPKFYLVCHYPETLYYSRYMLEKYGMTTYPEKTFSNGLFKTFNIYKVHSRADWKTPHPSNK
jgi:hypothetical protein